MADSRSSREMTPLHTAVEMGDIEIVKFLVSKGADIYYGINREKKDNFVYNDNLFDLAQRKGNDEIFSFFHSKAVHEHPEWFLDAEHPDMKPSHWSTSVMVFFFGENFGKFYAETLSHNRLFWLMCIGIVIAFAYVAVRVTYVLAKKLLTAKLNRKTQKDATEKEQESA